MSNLSIHVPFSDHCHGKLGQIEIPGLNKLASICGKIMSYKSGMFQQAMVCLIAKGYIYLSVCLSVYLPIYLSIDLSIYRSIYRSIYQSIHPSIHLSIYLSIYLSLRVCFPQVLYICVKSMLLNDPHGKIHGRVTCCKVVN